VPKATTGNGGVATAPRSFGSCTAGTLAAIGGFDKIDCARTAQNRNSAGIASRVDVPEREVPVGGHPCPFDHSERDCPWNRIELNLETLTEVLKSDWESSDREGPADKMITTPESASTIDPCVSAEPCVVAV
jgi:hypothetical protein